MKAEGGICDFFSNSLKTPFFLQSTADPKKDQNKGRTAKDPCGIQEKIGKFRRPSGNKELDDLITNSDKNADRSAPYVPDTGKSAVADEECRLCSEKSKLGHVGK